MTPSAPTPSFMRNAALGITQILLWGGSYFFMAVIANPVAASTNWSKAWVVGALSIAILVSGLPAPFVGRLIRRHGGRPVLIAGSLILAIGLVIAAEAYSLPIFLLGWAVIGAGMAACLYDPLFSAVGQAYGKEARGALTQITLTSGFAITLCWPASNFLVQTIGWRGACLSYAAVSVLVVIPLFAWALPSHVGITEAATPVDEKHAAAVTPKGLHRLTASFTVASMIMTAVSVELLMLLEQRGVSTDHAVALGALIGPAQVIARGLEGVFGKRAHPYWSHLASAVCALVGLLVLALAPSFAWLAIVFYGAGNGMRTIVRGTLPLALYGRDEYATVMGRLARSPLIGQAVTPLVAGLVIEHLGNSALLPGLLAIAAVNLLLSFAVFPLLGGGKTIAAAEPETVPSPSTEETSPGRQPSQCEAANA
ncbi:MFS transporter [Neorhizobium sp. P12A]|uniref:MFS transporter n=1 Tax=Neorhizobium sp. P12A TaxID=2268027 RepID=UPI0011F06F44|nr:MFS transporter [Neorhizobium sp. P12A]KAA0693329.1 MFS transporter [Neorhizobium sp. P12A]